jgi:hypothetical protein
MAQTTQQQINSQGSSQTGTIGNLGNIISGLFDNQLTQNLLGGGISYLGSQEVKDQIDKGIAAQATARSGLLDDITTRGQFQPFTVTSSLATPTLTQGSSYNPAQTYQAGDIVDTGGKLFRAKKGVLGNTAGLGNKNFWEEIPEGFGLGLSPQQQTLQDSLMTQASGVFNEIGADRATREQEVFNRLQALRQPQQERDRLELQNQLFQQGRQGLQTSAYGGTPEQLTFEKAIQEQQAADALAAMTQAGKERQEALALGSGLLGAGFVPQREALNLLTTGGNLARLPLALQRDVLGGAINTGREQLTSQAQMERDKTQVDLDLLEALVSLAAGQQNNQGNFAGGLLSSIGGAGGGFLQDIIDLF